MTEDDLLFSAEVMALNLTRQREIPRSSVFEYLWLIHSQKGRLLGVFIVLTLLSCGGISKFVDTEWSNFRASDCINVEFEAVIARAALNYECTSLLFIPGRLTSFEFCIRGEERREFFIGYRCDMSHWFQWINGRCKMTVVARKQNSMFVLLDNLHPRPRTNQLTLLSNP